MECIDVIKPGMLTTVQDLGRTAYQAYGISSGGAMDAFSLRLGNILVGNPEGAAAIEATLVGPTLRFSGDTVLAFTGANLSPKINGTPVPMWKTVPVAAGAILQFGANLSGCRTYIAVAGGIDVPEILGSRATFIRGGYGGMDGRALKEGDTVPVGKPKAHRGLPGRSIAPQHIPDFTRERPVRFVLGPQAEAFTDEAVATLVSRPYTISTDSDRMGYRLKGPPLAHSSSPDIISDYIIAGSIQVPGNGQPIILMADCQMTGGYAKIGVVIGVDIPYLAQKRPGDQVTFAQVDIKQAQQLWRCRERLIARLNVNNLRRD